MLVPPKGTRLKGEALWSAVLKRYELEHHELVLLREIVRCVDDLDRLSDVVVKSGAITAGGNVHPALTEARQLRVTLATLLATLNLPAGHLDEYDESDSSRPGSRAVVHRLTTSDLPSQLQSSYAPVAADGARIRRRAVRARSAQTPIPDLLA